MFNPFEILAGIAIARHEQKLTDIKRMRLQNRLKFADSPEQRYQLLKQINQLKTN